MNEKLPDNVEKQPSPIRQAERPHEGRFWQGVSLDIHSVAKPSGVWETGGMKKPELTDMAWLGPKEEMDRASHRFGKCSECHEIICVEKAVTDGPSTQGKTSEVLYEAFRAHVKLKHSEDFNLAAIPATERHQA
jgi:hypothetical protein